MPWERLCTPEELREFCRPGAERVHHAIDDGDTESVREVVAEVTISRTRMANTLTNWAALTFEYLLQQGGVAALAEALQPEDLMRFAGYADVRPNEAEQAQLVFRGEFDATERIVALVEAGEGASAKA